MSVSSVDEFVFELEVKSSWISSLTLHSLMNHAVPSPDVSPGAAVAGKYIEVL